MNQKLTLDQFKALIKEPQKAKYGNQKMVVEGIRFDSKREAERYKILRLMEKAGHIHDLQIQVGLPLEVNGFRVGMYIADFFYRTKEGVKVYEDCKGYKTPVYQLKKRLVKAIYGINILET